MQKVRIASQWDALQVMGEDAIASLKHSLMGTMIENGYFSYTVKRYCYKCGRVYENETICPTDSASLIVRVIDDAA